MEASTGATWLSSKSLKSISLLDMFLGNVGSAAVGETCVIAILLGYIYLSIRKVIDWRIPLMIIGWSAIFALLFDGAIKSKLSGEELWLNLGAHVLSGGLIFGAVFMATDYATSPNTFIGNCVFCFGIALFTMLIRVFAHFPEGISFAILIMNCLTPLIDKYIVPRPFGFVKKAKKKEMTK
jgi:Na+-translocating ferredoxin:NAD+ oxidoreductase RnfD subunit